MDTCIRKSCGADQSNAVPVRRQDQVTLTLDKQIARAILRKLQDIAEDAEESLQIAKKFNNAHVAEYEAYMSKARKQYTSFYRALQEAQSWKQL